MKILLTLLLLSILIPARSQEIRAFWVDAFNEGFKTPEQADKLLERVRTANCNAIFVQVRKRGDAYYQSRYEPWASDDQNHWDALAYLIDKAHNSTPRIQVHAWLNTCAVNSVKGNPWYMVVMHPEWLSLSDKGENRDTESTKIDPGNPDAADWTFRVYLDVARHYDVDGIHFDFVRYGAANFGYNPVNVARYNARYNKDGQPDAHDPLWKQWRRDQVTALVRKVYAVAAAVKPRLTVSAATVTWEDGPQELAFWNDKSAPMNRTYQDWRSWMREGIIDLNCQMAYYNEKKHPDYFRHWIDWAKDNQYQRWAVPGAGVWFNTIEDTFKQIDRIRSRSSAGNAPKGVLLYSYASTNATDAGKAQTYNDEFYAALSKPSKYSANPPFAAPSQFPDIPWKTHPTAGSLMGFLLTADGLNPVDGAIVTATGHDNRTQRTDGTGFFAFINMPPGTYRVVFDADGYTKREKTVTVKAGEAADAGELMGSVSTPFTLNLAATDSLPIGAPVRFKALHVMGGTDTFPGCLYVFDASRGAVCFKLAQTPLEPYQPGDLVAAVGRISLIDGERVVDQAVVRLVGMERREENPISPQPEDIVAVAMKTPRLLSVTGKVVSVEPNRFTLDVGGYALEAMLANRKDPGVESPTAPLAPPQVGAWLQVTGVGTIATLNGKQAIRMHPRTSEDIQAEPEPAVSILTKCAKWLTASLFVRRSLLAAPTAE